MATDHNFKVKKGLDVLGGDVNLGDGFAYKIDGSTVVDSSRNLTNIGTISTAGNITSAGRGSFSAGPGGQGLHLNSSSSWSSGTLYAPGLLWREADGTNIAGIRGFVNSNGDNHLTLGTGWLDHEVTISSTGVSVSGSLSTGDIIITPNTVTARSGGRQTVIGNSSGNITTKGVSGGWAFGYHALGSSSTDHGGFGFLGSGDTFSYYYIGASYSSGTNFRFHKDGTLKIGTTTILDSSRNFENIHDLTLDGVVRSTNNANVDGPNFNVSTTNKDTAEYAYRVDRSGTVKGGITINGTFKSTTGMDLTEDSAAYISLNRSAFITFYGNANSHHAIGSRNESGAASDDLRINSYAALHINLDSNNNNTSSADFTIGKHGGGTGTISNLFTVSGEDGTTTVPYVRITGTGDAALASTTHGLQVGSTSGNNVIIDDNEVMARNNGSAGTLYLQGDGGTVSIGGGTAANLTVTGSLTVNGTTTTLNTATLNVEDKNITLNYGSGDTSASANGSGITIQDAMAENHNATILWNTSEDRFDFSDPINLAVTGPNNTPDSSTVTVSGYGMIGNRGNLYITNANSSGLVQIGVGGAHNANPKLTITSSATTSTVPVSSTGLTIYPSDAQLKFNAEAYKIKGGGYYGDIRIVAPRFRVYEDNESGTAKFQIDGGNATFTGTITSGAITSSGDSSVGASGNISMSSASAGQLKVLGLGYTGAIALDANAMHIYHNSSSRDLVLGTNETARLNISGTGLFDFQSNNLQSIGTISSGAITSTGNVKGASLETNHTITFDYNDHYLQAGTGSVFFKNSSGASLGGIDASGFNTPYNYQIAGTTVIDGSRNLTNIGTITNSGKISSSIGSNATYSRPLLEITSSSTPTQIKITTNILYSGTGASTHAHSVRISGFQYGSAQMADLQIGWHVYQNQFYNRSVTSSGSWAPTVTLAVENNKVVIHLASPGYWPKLYVESMYNAYGGAGQASGWSWTDAAISADSNTPNQTVPYKFDYGNGVLKAGGTTVIDASRNLTNIGTISSGAITSSGAISASGALSAGAVSTFSGGSSDYAATFSSTDAYSGIRFQDPDGSGTIYYRGATDHLYLNSSTFSVGGSTLATNYEFQVNGDANITGGLAINGTTTITSSRELRNLNGNVRSDSNFQFLTSGGSAQNVRTKSVFAGSTYGDTPPAGSVNATNTYELNGTTVINSSGEFVGGLNPSSLDITHSSADSVLRIAHGANNALDAVIQLSGSAANMATEGAEIWYDNSVGDVHIATTYAHDDAYIRFHTRTGASKSTSNERLTIAANGTVGINKASGLDSSYKLDMGGHIKMNNNHIHYINQAHFHQGTRFIGSSTSTTVLRSATSTNSNWLAFQSGSSNTTRGYVGGNSDSGYSVGLLDAGGDWAVRHINDQGTEFRQNNQVISSIGQSLVSGDYGSMTVNDTKNGWGGYSINNRVVFMHDHGNTAGLYNDVNNHWLVKTQNGGTTELYFNGSKKLETTTSGAVVTGNIAHDGLTMTSGTDVDQLYTVTDSLTLTTSYQDTSINSSELATGTYIMQMYAHDHGNGGFHYNEYYSGVISWYGAGTNSAEVDEIVLHRAGHAPNAGVIHLRTQRHASGGDNLVLQIKANYTRTAASNYTFKFRRMI